MAGQSHQLNVFATLKGSLFAIPDEMLLLYRQTARWRWHPLRAVD